MKKTIITILLVVLCLGIVGGGIAGIVKLTDTGKLDTKTLASTKFSVGGLDSNGKYMNTNASIYTKEAFECQGLEVSLDFDNEIEYQIYFYDQNNDFVHTTGKLSGAFVKDSVPFFAKYARIVVTPKNDDVVSKIEVLKYAGQLTVKVNREQGFKNYTENLAKWVLVDSGINTATGEVVELEGQSVSDYINLSQYKEMLLFRSIGDIGNYSICFYDSEKQYCGFGILNEISSLSFMTSEGVRYYALDLGNLSLKNGISSNPFVFTRFKCSTSAPFEVVCR